MLSQPGLKWVLNKCLEAEPTWSHDPKVKTIIKLARKHLRFSLDDNCTADYYMQGAFNKIYLIRCPRNGADEQSFIFRVSLPVDPGFKVATDVATMTFVRTHTDAPVPHVIAFDPSHENELGFAWTIMEMMPGRPLCEYWRFLSMMQKEKLVKRVADVVAQMFRHKFRGIGNLYQIPEGPPPLTVKRNGQRIAHNFIDNMTKSTPAMVACKEPKSTNDVEKDWPASKYSIGRIVSMSFLWHKRVHYDVYRGPFPCTFDWLAARLNFVILESMEILNDHASDQNRKVSAKKHASIAKRLRQQLPNFFLDPNSRENETVLEITTLHHFDMSGYNVMADAQGNLTALLDWDGISTVPLWKACQMPEFLVSQFIDEIGDGEPAPIDANSLASQMSRAKAIALEKEHFRACFLAEMERMEPEWAHIYRISIRPTDFDTAVHLCDSQFKSSVIEKWLQDIEQGKGHRSLRHFLLGDDKTSA